MNYNKIYITGDCHRDFSRFKILKDEEDIAVIILGDAGVNWTLDQNDQDFKHSLQKKYPNITWYLLRGNHEARPSALPTIQTDWDDEVQGYVMYEPDFLNIRYFLDIGEYTINDHSILTIGGAYSVDKWYRLERGYRWFSNEQLTEKEMHYATNFVKSKTYDFVFSHTCPRSWEPTDLFLGGIDQSTVDKSMENWLEGLKDSFVWNVWLFGHYHADRLERPHVEQLYQVIENLDNIWDRWYGENEILNWWIRKSPNYYMES